MNTSDVFLKIFIVPHRNILSETAFKILKFRRLNFVVSSGVKYLNHHFFNFQRNNKFNNFEAFENCLMLNCLENIIIHKNIFNIFQHPF